MSSTPISLTCVQGSRLVEDGDFFTSFINVGINSNFLYRFTLEFMGKPFYSATNMLLFRQC